MNKPESHKFNNLEIGMMRKFSLTIDESLVLKFSEISGDNNPLHMEDEFAKKSKFHQRICHGMLLGSFFSKLVGMHLPGLNSLYISQTLNFQKPCFLGDEIIVSGKITDKSEATKIVTLETLIHNTSGDCLVSGEAKSIVLE